jgi:protein required for attachment to host cells
MKKYKVDPNKALRYELRTRLKDIVLFEIPGNLTRHAHFSIMMPVLTKCKFNMVNITLDSFYTS